MYPSKDVMAKQKAISTVRLALLLDSKGIIQYIYSIPNDRRSRHYRFDHNHSPLNLEAKYARPYFAALMREHSLTF